MGRIAKLTNFSFVYLVFLVLVSLGLGIGLYPFDATIKLLTFFALLVGINMAGASIANIVRVKFIDTNSIWLQPVSTKVSSLLTNGVVFIWLGVVGLLMIMLLQGKGVITTIFMVVVFLLAGIGSSLHLQRRFSWNILLPYGIGFLGSLLLVIIIMTGYRFISA